MSVQLAHLYVMLCLARALFHAALLGGVPLAHLAPGGGPEGALAARAKPQSVLAVAVFTLQAGAMLVAAGFPGLSGLAWLPGAGWAGAITLALPLIGAALALLSRAEVDRRLWLPLEAAMAALSLAVLTG